MKIACIALLMLVAPPALAEPAAEPAATTTSAPAGDAKADVAPAPTEQKPEVKPEPMPQPGPVTGKVTQVFRDNKRAVATLSSTQDIPETLVFTNPKGDACEGRVVETRGDQALIDFASCTNFDQIVAGLTLTPPVFKNETAPSEVQPEPRADYRHEEPPAQRHHETAREYGRPRVSLMLGYSSGGRTYYDDARYSSTTTGDATGTDDIRTAGAGEVSLGVLWAPAYHWGFAAGFTAEEPRKLSRDSQTIDGVTTNYDFSDRPTMQYSLIEASALYRWSFFYLPFGLNYSLPIARFPTVTSTTSVSVAGGVGAQFGIGFLVGSCWRFEFLFESISAKLKVQTATDTTDYGSGMLGTATVRAGVYF